MAYQHKIPPEVRKQLLKYTNSGHKLTVKEAQFIFYFLETNNASEAARKAHYGDRKAGKLGKELLAKDYIREEIEYQLECIQDSTIANATEVLQYFTRVMRGMEKDQFGLEAPLSERTKAAQELAKRQIDAFEKAKQAEQGAPEIHLVLDWNRDSNISQDNNSENTSLSINNEALEINIPTSSDEE